MNKKIPTVNERNMLLDNGSIRIIESDLRLEKFPNYTGFVLNRYPEIGTEYGSPASRLYLVPEDVDPKLSTEWIKNGETIVLENYAIGTRFAIYGNEGE